MTSFVVPGHSQVHPRDASISSFLTWFRFRWPRPSPVCRRHGIRGPHGRLPCPWMGIGVIPQEHVGGAQAGEVDRVKRSERRDDLNPIQLLVRTRPSGRPTALIARFSNQWRSHRGGGMGGLVGISSPTGTCQYRDGTGFGPCGRWNDRDRLDHGAGGDHPGHRRGQCFHEHRIEKLPVCGRGGEAPGLITVKDIFSGVSSPPPAKDDRWPSSVAAAIVVADGDWSGPGRWWIAGWTRWSSYGPCGHSEGVLQRYPGSGSASPMPRSMRANVGTAAGAAALVGTWVRMP